MKILTVIGTRPEIIRLSCIIKKLDKFMDHILVHTGQNYDFELNQVFFDDLKIRKPDYFLNAAGKNASETIGQILIEFDKVLDIEKPDAMLILGDTNSGLSVIPAKKRKIPIFHMEAGNRCFDQRVPEETNRKIIDHTSDINLTYSKIAREYLLAEGFPADQIIRTGSPMYEILHHYKEDIYKSSILSKLELEEYKYFVFSCHREENVDDESRIKIVANTINTIAKKYDYPIIFSTHPRTRKKIEQFKIELHKNVIIIKPLGFLDYIKLQKKAFCVISDSGTITEESSILNFPALNLRESHERPEGMEEGSVIMTGLNINRVLDSIEIVKEQSRDEERELSLVSDYDVNNVSEKVLRIILSYTDYINRKVWFKSI